MERETSRTELSGQSEKKTKTKKTKTHLLLQWLQIVVIFVTFEESMNVVSKDYLLSLPPDSQGPPTCCI